LYTKIIYLVRIFSMTEFELNSTKRELNKSL
jgi:hypothetical protein